MLLLHLLGGLTDEEVDIIVAEELDLLANGEGGPPSPERWYGRRS